MDRRKFLEGLLGGAALLTLTQREKLEDVVKALPGGTRGGPEESPKSYADSTVFGLSIDAPVERVIDLPRSAEPGEARWVGDEEKIYIFADKSVGWVVFAQASPVVDTIGKVF